MKKADLGIDQSIIDEAVEHTRAQEEPLAAVRTLNIREDALIKEQEQTRDFALPQAIADASLGECDPEDVERLRDRLEEIERELEGLYGGKAELNRRAREHDQAVARSVTLLTEQLGASLERQREELLETLEAWHQAVLRILEPLGEPPRERVMQSVPLLLDLRSAIASTQPQEGVRVTQQGADGIFRPSLGRTMMR